MAVAVVLIALHAILDWKREALPPLVAENLRYLQFLAAIPAIIAAVRLFEILLFDFFLWRRTREHVPTLLREIVAFVLYFILFGLAINLILKISLTGYVISGTVLAAVLGLALQDTLGNLFAGISLHVEKTYEVGDVLRSGDAIGTVEWASWRATQVRTLDNDLLIIPNAILARERLEVFPRDNLNARVVRVSAGYEYQPARVIAVMERAAKHVNGVATEIAPIARIGDFAESGVVYELKYWTRRYDIHQAIDAEIRKALWYAFARGGIAVARPIRSVERRRPAAPPVVPEARIAERLANVEVFAPLSAEERERLVERIAVQYFGRGELILRRGEGGDSMFVVEEGSVSVRRGEEQNAVEVARLGPGEMFGEMGLLTGQGREASVVAESDVVALEIDKESLHPILQQNPRLVETISRIVAERRTRLAQGPQSLDETQPRLFARIASWFGI
ncbi:MAG: cyclic nucleotide-binding domain-containing protein [Thermoanaerobaculia bacterium]